MDASSSSTSLNSPQTKTPLLHTGNEFGSSTKLNNDNGDFEDSEFAEEVRIEHVRPMEFEEEVEYRLYPWRFVGLVAMVLLNIGSGINSPWFGTIANATSQDFQITLTQINWLSNSGQLIFIVVSVLIPGLNKRVGMRSTCLIAAITMVVGAWIRVGATARTLSPHGAYGVLILGQIINGLAQPVFLALGPFYSEQWFDFTGRTTATMIVSIANPIGSALGQILSPLSPTPRKSILLLAIITSVFALPALLIKSKPPTPPTMAGSQPPLGAMVTVRSMLNKSRPDEYQMDFREKIDFVILTFGFGIYSAAIVVFSLLSNQILAPEGYSASSAGFLGAAMIFSGLLAAAVTAPLFDRVFTRHLAISIKLVTPILGIAWFSLIFAARPHNLGALYPLFVIIGIGSLMLLPITLELASEVTRNTDTSSAFLWASGNVFGFVFVIVQNALRDKNAPFSMRRALIFNGTVILIGTGAIQLLRGRQTRRDAQEMEKKKGVELTTVR